MVPAEDHDVPVEWQAPYLRQPGCQVDDLTRGFASPPRDGFASIGKGSPLITVRQLGDYRWLVRATEKVG